MKEYSFEKLGVWKESRKLSLKIYRLTAKFPVEERYVLTSQMRRAVTSVCSNLAEGVSRISFKDQARFSEISFGSLMELLCQAILSSDLLFITNEELNDLRKDVDSIGYKINELKKSQLEKHASGNL